MVEENLVNGFFNKITPQLMWIILVAIIGMAFTVGNVTTRLKAAETVNVDHEDRIRPIEQSISRMETNIETILEELRND